MKLLAILLMLLVLVILAGAGVMYLMMFAMSFDAPGSTTDPKGWFMRFVLFLPLVACVVVLIFSFLALRDGNAGRAVAISGSAVAAAAILWTIFTVSSMRSMREYQDKVKQEKEWEKQFPVQKFVREKEIGADTIIVWPSKIVAYRIGSGDGPALGGGVGMMNDTRDTLIYSEHFDNRIPRNELEQFVNEQGRRFTDVYQVK
jgi:uncharacterized membrane protein